MITEIIVLEFAAFCSPLRGGETVIGRSIYCSVVIHDGSVSRMHASITRSDDRLEVLDMGSKNGTFLNDIRIGREATPFKPGDALRFGDVSCKVAFASDAQEAERETDRPTSADPSLEETTGQSTRPEVDEQREP